MSGVAVTLKLFISIYIGIVSLSEFDPSLEECEKEEAAVADAHRLHPDRRASCFMCCRVAGRCPLCQGRACKSGVPSEQDWCGTQHI